ncbi:MAG TPA: hypothetical protein VFI31_16445, partial [Pirellulales bacterium]|nr:hypothetical protein [Pirellulales bacterium]
DCGVELFNELGRLRIAESAHEHHLLHARQREDVGDVFQHGGGEKAIALFKGRKRIQVLRSVIASQLLIGQQ